MKVETVVAYVKEKIKKRNLRFKYKNTTSDIKNITFEFKMEPTLTPLGDIVFTAGYKDDPDQTNTFIMTAQDAIRLAKLLTDTAYDAMDNKLIANQQESCESQLSFLVLKHLIDSIRIERGCTLLHNYEPPYYEYTISAYKGKDKVLSYDVAYNLSYFTTEGEIKYWMDKLTDGGRVKLYFDGWDPYKELEERKKVAQEKMLEKLKDYKNLQVINV